jgi:hypothetical protein
MTILGLSRRHLFAGCLLAQGLLILGIVAIARAGAAASTIVIGLAACFVPYALALSLTRDLFGRARAEQLALSALFVFGLALVFAPPALSDDVHRFVWEGRVWLEGSNPYALAPADPSLAHLRNESWTAINNKPLASIYPPLTQVLFVLIGLLGGGIWTAKLLALIAHSLTTIAVSKISSDSRAPLALALNPLLLSEGALNGHLDVLTGLALLVAAGSLSQHRIIRAAIATCVAVGLKAVGVVMFPLFARRPVALLVVAVVSALLLSPLVVFAPLADSASGPVQFAARWRGNESFYAVVDWISLQVFDPSVATTLARASVFGIVLAVGALSVAKRVPPVRATRILLWTTLLLSPQVHPWYLAWLLPIEISSGGLAGLVWSASVLCAYAPIDRWLAEGVWEMPIGLQIAEYSLVAAAWVIEGRGSLRPARFNK